MARRSFAAALLTLMVFGAACGDDASALVDTIPDADTPIDGPVRCEVGDLIADLSSTPSFPPQIDVPAISDAEIESLADRYTATVFADTDADLASSVAAAGSGPVRFVALERPDDAGAGGWLTVALVDGEWTITGYTVCNRFGFGG